MFSGETGKTHGNIFLNCGFGDAKYGVSVIKSENITFKDCWFETTFIAVKVDGSKKVSILDSRFANAGGCYGSLSGSSSISELNLGSGIKTDETTRRMHSLYRFFH
ncbi:MAG: hypothetical protein R2773_06290 [Flavobacteriaceae bacterium]